MYQFFFFPSASSSRATQSKIVSRPLIAAKAKKMKTWKLFFALLSPPAAHHKATCFNSAIFTRHYINKISGTAKRRSYIFIFYVFVCKKKAEKNSDFLFNFISPRSARRRRRKQIFPLQMYEFYMRSEYKISQVTIIICDFLLAFRSASQPRQRWPQLRERRVGTDGD